MRMQPGLIRGAWAVFLLLLPRAAHAQIDPYSRNLLQVGYNQPLEGKAPFAAYAFYYHNNPGFLRTNLTLRAAIAPVYLDSELGFRHLLGPHTDLGVGLAGGGFAFNHAEIREGTWIKEESFNGHGGETSLSAYHLFNPLPEGQSPSRLSEIPVQGILRGGMNFTLYQRNGDTGDNFEIPDDVPAGFVRAGIRCGGREPLIDPAVALEASVFYQGNFRLQSGPYGYDGDRDMQATTHQFMGRVLAAFTFTNSLQRVEGSLTVGTSMNPDRLNVYRLGGTLPLAAEMPLMLPGYYFEELSSRRFFVAHLWYGAAVAAQWTVLFQGGTALVDYLPGLEQAGDWHSGVGGGIGWTSRGGSWHVIATYAYGIDAIRSHGRGAQNIGILAQVDLERHPLNDFPGATEARRIFQRFGPSAWRGVGRLFGR